MRLCEKLKVSFNKSTKQGGFWDEEKQCYIHWRDKDNSIHGNNMVTPVNFMAIAYGICDDKNRRNIILDEIEMQMQKEKLFFWPICMFSYQVGEGNDWQFPFPNYENGDIFLSWGSIAVQAYADYKPELALKYVENVLTRHSKDGLAFQRYGRTKQDGLGDDILSGNSLSVVGLYYAIYGINPLYNRLYINPHITRELVGTELYYDFRGEKLSISLNEKKYAISNNQFKITSKTDFGFYAKANKLDYFNAKEEHPSISAKTEKGRTLSLEIIGWGTTPYSWSQSSTSEQTKVTYRLANLKPDFQYTIWVDGKKIKGLRSNSDGVLLFEFIANKKPQIISIL